MTYLCRQSSKIPGLQQLLDPMRQCVLSQLLQNEPLRVSCRTGHFLYCTMTLQALIVVMP